MSNFNSKDLDFIPNLPKGPLDKYRQQASFDWKELKVVIERSVENVKLQYKVWNLLESDPVFEPNFETVSLDEQRHRAALQIKRLSENNSLQVKDIDVDTLKKINNTIVSNYAMKSSMPDAIVKFGIGCDIAGYMIRELGTERHASLSQAIWNKEIIGSVSMTEVSNGSSTKALRTTATYDPKTQEFILNTPDFLAAKYLIGNMGKTATYSVVFAQLYTNDTCYGLHTFLVPVRDPVSLKPYPGILVGDIGEKISLNGVDNGFLIFKNYRIKRELLLNRISDVTPSGEYIFTITDPSLITIKTFEVLIPARIAVSYESVSGLTYASVIAVRYAAVREIISSNNNNNTPLIDYQLHQWRIFPYLASSVLLKLFIIELNDIYFSIKMNNKTEEKYSAKNNTQEGFMSELHGIVSATKPLITWTSLNSTTDCRQACGGHGFLKASNFGELRKAQESEVTFEGDNNVLLLQTSNWLLGQYRRFIKDKEPISSPLKTISFIENTSTILNTKFTGNILSDVTNEKFIINAFQWLICWLLTITEKKIKSEMKSGKSKLDATSNSQVFRANILSRAYADYVVLFVTKPIISSVKGPCNQVLRNMYILYGLSSIEKYLTYFYHGQYTSSPKFAELVHDGVTEMCARMRPDAISIADAVAPTDFALNSVIGSSDGKLYENLQRELFYNKGSFERPSWWRDISKSKL